MRNYRKLPNISFESCGLRAQWCDSGGGLGTKGISAHVFWRHREGGFPRAIWTVPYNRSGGNKERLWRLGTGLPWGSLVRGAGEWAGLPGVAGKHSLGFPEDQVCK